MINTIFWGNIYNNDSINENASIPGLFRVDGSLKPVTVINSVMPYIFAFAGAILMLYLIAGGFKLMTSQGKPDEIGKGKAMITNALIGLLLIFASYWILDLIGLITGSTQLQNII